MTLTWGGTLLFRSLCVVTYLGPYVALDLVDVQAANGAVASNSDEATNVSGNFGGPAAAGQTPADSLPSVQQVP